MIKAKVVVVGGLVIDYISLVKEFFIPFIWSSDKQGIWLFLADMPPSPPSKVAKLGLSSKRCAMLKLPLKNNFNKPEEGRECFRLGHR